MRYWYAVVVVALITAGGYFIEDRKEWFPWLVVFQSGGYQALTSMDARPSRATHVVGVEIDQHTIETSFNGTPFVPPVFLAKVVQALAAANPAVIVVNADLNCSDDIGEAAAMHSMHDCIKHAGQRGRDAHVLLAALRAVSDRVPVVLGMQLDQNPIAGYYAQLPMILADTDLPPNVTVGFRNRAAVDMRQIPLFEDVYKPFAWGDSNALVSRYSLSMATVRAYESLLNITPQTQEESRIKRATDARAAVYSTFLRRAIPSKGSAAIPHVLAADVVRRERAATRSLAHRIAVIGVFSDEARVFDTPVGSMEGMYLQANYIERC